MRTFRAVLLSAFVSFTVATNTTIRYYSTKEGCVDNYFQCSNIPIGYCCQASSPWCSYVDCPDCIVNGVTTDSLLTHGNGACADDPVQPVCVSTSTKSNICCAVDYKDKPDICSTMVTTDVGKREEGDGCLGVVQPDTLVYTNVEGVTNNVHLPNGTFNKAVKFAKISDWNGLVGFVGQAST